MIDSIETINSQTYLFDVYGNTSNYGYHNDDMYTYLIKDKNGNQYLWHSSYAPIEIKSGDTLVASVKYKRYVAETYTTVITRGSIKN